MARIECRRCGQMKGVDSYIKKTSGKRDPDKTLFKNCKQCRMDKATKKARRIGNLEMAVKILLVPRCGVCGKLIKKPAGGYLCPAHQRNNKFRENGKSMCDYCQHYDLCLLQLQGKMAALCERLDLADILRADPVALARDARVKYLLQDMDPKPSSWKEFKWLMLESQGM